MQYSAFHVRGKRCCIRHPLSQGRLLAVWSWGWVADPGDAWLVTCVTNECKAGVYNLGRPWVVNLVRTWLVIFLRSSYPSGWWLSWWEQSGVSTGQWCVFIEHHSHRAQTALSSQLPNTGCGQRRGGPQPTDGSGQSPGSPEPRPNNTSFFCMPLSSLCNWGGAGTVEIRYHSLKNLLLLSYLIWKWLLDPILQW